MNKMTTHSGIEFDPISPDINGIKINDIAHALSLMCRGNGHLNYFYSVAQHCVNCALEARKRNYTSRVQLICLLHDASEAYIADIVRPIKSELDKYLEIEENLQSLIYNKYLNYAPTKEELAQMKEIDDDILIKEFEVLMNKEVTPNIKGKLNFELTQFNIIEENFIQLFNELTKKLI